MKWEVAMETYNGHVRTPADAILLFEACRLGLLPRVQRRLSEKERQSIKSGSVFVWDEREAGMRRWTDGKSWSASRVSGSFLTYREMEGKRCGNSFAPPVPGLRAGKTPDSTRGSDSDLELAGAGEDNQDGYRYKPDGLMKQSFSITTSAGNHLHLISYYSRSHQNSQGLQTPTSDPALRQIRPAKGMYPESTVHESSIPAVTRAPMVSASYSTVPQMAGYARGPAYPQQAYSWSPAPPIPPPQHYHYSPNIAQHPGASGHSPLTYAIAAHPPTSQPQISSGYDSAHPAENLHTNLQHQNANSGNGMPDYHHKSSPRGPPRLMRAYPQQPQQQQQQQHHQHQPHQHQQLHQQLQQQHPPPNTIHQQAQAQPQARNRSSTPPPISQIDPRLMKSPSPPPTKQESIDPNGNSNSNYNNTNNNTMSTGVATGSTSQASTIPSIGSLMNNAPADNTDAKSDISTHSSNRSPNGTAKKKEDIRPGPGFGVEDQRAIRVLDRAFKTT